MSTHQDQASAALDRAPAADQRSWRARVVDALRALLAPVGPMPGGVTPALVLAALAGGGTLLRLLRQTGVPATDTLWAEDGSVFLQQALDGGPLEAIAEPYMGYTHLAPRLLGELAAALPVSWAAAVMAVASAAVVALLAAVVFLATAGKLSSMPLRIAVASAVLLAPVGGAEVLNNAANLHWFLMFTSFLVLLWRPTSPGQQVAGAAVVGLSAASDPLTALLVPVLALRWWSRRTAAPDLIGAAFVVGLAAQLAGMLVGDAGRDFPLELDPLRVAGLYGVHVLTRAAFGNFVPPDGDGAVTAVLGVLAVALAALLLWGAARRFPSPQTVLALLAVAYSVVFYAAPVVLTGFSTPRYAVIPCLLLVTAAAAIIDDWPRPTGVASRRNVRRAALALVVVVWGAGFFAVNERSDGPRWSSELERVEQECDDSPAVTAVLPPSSGDWDVELSCDIAADG